MPELPEVETVKKALVKNLIGHKITRVEVLYDKIIKTPLDEFMSCFNDVQILDIQRIGKFLIFIFDNNKIMLSHLRMEGKYYYLNEEEQITKHTHIVFHLNDNKKFVYDDSRKFGCIEIHDKVSYLNSPSLSKLGPEPFDCDKHYLYEKLSKCNIEIKSALLDQSILSGLGNIYVDETLFACKINPFVKASSISLEQCEDIIINSQKILLRAIEQGGSTISSYHPEAGIDGKFQIELQVYGKKGYRCPKCNTSLLKDFCHGRGTTYCPNCQNVAIKVGICGSIASGKTTTINYLKQKGYKTFSSDQCVHEFYSTLVAKTFFVNLLGEGVLNDDGKISRPYIKSAILKDPLLKNKIEAFVHPYVNQQIQKFIKNNIQEKLIFIEVPLMFEAKTDKLMDYIIAVDASYETKIKNLINRGSKTPIKDLKLNNNVNIEKHLNKCDFIINNNLDLDNLYLQIDNILTNIISR